MTPKRSVKGKSFMKKRHSPHTCPFRNPGTPPHCYRSKHKPIMCVFDFGGDEGGEMAKRGPGSFKERTESGETAGMPDQMGVRE